MEGPEMASVVLQRVNDIKRRGCQNDSDFALSWKIELNINDELIVNFSAPMYLFV